MLEFCTDPRFDEDTLFIIFEEDFRFTPEVGDPAWTHNGRKDTSATIFSSMFGPSPPPDPKASSSSAAAAEEASSSAAASSHNMIPRAKKEEPPVPPNFWSRKEREAAGDYVVQNRASGADWKQPSIFLRDLVAYATLAHRRQRGDFMFMGWQPHGAGESDSTKNKNNMRSGLMCSMVSQEGFLHLETQWRFSPQLTAAGHVDCKLKNFWSLPVNSRVSYITPPIGGYTSHISGCEKAFFTKERPCIWLEDFACPGTRRAHDWTEKPRQKWLCTFRSNGKVDWICRVDVAVPDESVWWLSCDQRVARGPAEPTAGWGNAAWDNDRKTWIEKTDREMRASRALRQREKFRHWTTRQDEARYCIVLHTCFERFVAVSKGDSSSEVMVWRTVTAPISITQRPKVNSREEKSDLED